MKIFGYETEIEKESEKKSKFLEKKNHLVALAISIEKTPVAQCMTEQLL